jgi:hypothetical protein
MYFSQYDKIELTNISMPYVRYRHMSICKDSPSSNSMENASPISDDAVGTIEKTRIEAALLCEKQLRQFYERIHKRISDRSEDELEKSQIHGWRSRLVMLKPAFS